MLTLALFTALATVAAAVPMEKRDIHYTTTTTEVIEYVSITTTVWVDSLPTTSATIQSGGEFYNIPQNTSDSAPPSSVVSSYIAPVSVAALQPAVTTSIPVPAPAAAPTTTTAAAPQEPVTTNIVAAEVAAPSVAAPAPAPVFSSQPSTPVAAAAAPQAASSAGSTVHSGDITYYDVGMGSCGIVSTADQPVVALAINMMNNPANPNNNPLCGKTITISYGGATHQATVLDTCHDCSLESIDLSTSLFKAVAPNGDGRVHNVNWWFN